ncbi:hypothetical protein P7B02_11370 [Caulobacter segnis]|uniref:hypothetical protein n=1 Tax=Caulobacter segnis TaxID=88688 RepID=UPI00241033DE|nr:hypothetical protein [Caulobacter segnis]MDG2522140.1 hypothetical protein [Caulobacter segnis]
MAADSALAYLWAARNADEHGVAPISAPQESIIAVGAFGGYEESVRTEGDGRRIYTYTPTCDDPPPFISFLPEHLRLQPVMERGQLHAVPDGYNYDLGETFAAVALAAYGLDFLRREMSDLQG